MLFLGKCHLLLSVQGEREEKEEKEVGGGQRDLMQTFQTRQNLGKLLKNIDSFTRPPYLKNKFET